MFVCWLLEALDALEGLGLFQNRVQSYNIFFFFFNKMLNNIYFLSPIDGRCYRSWSFFVGNDKKLDGIEDVLPNDICRSSE